MKPRSQALRSSIFFLLKAISSAVPSSPPATKPYVLLLRHGNSCSQAAHGIAVISLMRNLARTICRSLKIWLRDAGCFTYCTCSEDAQANLTIAAVQTDDVGSRTHQCQWSVSECQLLHDNCLECSPACWPVDVMQGECRQAETEQAACEPVHDSH